MAEKVKILLLDTNDAMGGVVQAHLLLLRTLDRARFDIYHAYIAQSALMHILTETTPTSLSAADLLVLKTIYPAFKITILDACMEAVDTRHIATQTQTHALLKAVNMFI